MVVTGARSLISFQGESATARMVLVNVRSLPSDKRLTFRRILYCRSAPDSDSPCDGADGYFCCNISADSVDRPRERAK